LPSRRNPTLAYLYRTYLASKLVQGVSVGRFLEIGVGRGKFYEELEQCGFTGVCLDLNPGVIEEHQLARKSWNDTIQFLDRDFFSLEDEFDLVIAFEVLEHFQEDLICLMKWNSLLKREGILLFSVPAHRRHWTRNDERAGHARRYEKNELQKKLKAAGFRITDFWCYGFPVLNWTYPLSSYLRWRGETSVKFLHSTDASQLTQQYDVPIHSAPAPRIQDSSRHLQADFDKTRQSGTRRFPLFTQWILHKSLWRAFLELQRPFLDRDMGIGYMVKCRKAE
jgi:SAM-dependent methyltransferase